MACALQLAPVVQLPGFVKAIAERPIIATPITFLKHLARELDRDQIDDVAAMMTYYALFALFPMAIFVVTMTLLVLPSDVIQQSVAMAGEALPQDVVVLLGDQVGRMEAAAAGGFAVGSAALALWGASRGANALALALNRVHQKRETRPWWRRQINAIGSTLVVTLLLIVAMSLLVIGPAVGGALADRLGLGAAFDPAWTIGRWVGAVLLVMVVWAMLYSWLPNVHVPFRIITPGAVVGVTLWLLATQLFALYVRRFGDFEATYGALGAVIVFMTWLWISNLAILFGAEVNDALAQFRRDRSEAAAELARRELPKEPGAMPTSPT